nr:immunoglobulin heavy chain junction region [Macaca mulatta]
CTSSVATDSPYW